MWGKELHKILSSLIKNTEDWRAKSKHGVLDKEICLHCDIRDRGNEAFTLCDHSWHWESSTPSSLKRGSQNWTGLILTALKTKINCYETRNSYLLPCLAAKPAFCTPCQTTPNSPNTNCAFSLKTGYLACMIHFWTHSKSLIVNITFKNIKTNCLQKYCKYINWEVQCNENFLKNKTKKKMNKSNQ